MGRYIVSNIDYRVQNLDAWELRFYAIPILIILTLSQVAFGSETGFLSAEWIKSVQSEKFALKEQRSLEASDLKLFNSFHELGPKSSEIIIKAFASGCPEGDEEIAEIEKSAKQMRFQFFSDSYRLKSENFKNPNDKISSAHKIHTLFQEQICLFSYYYKKYKNINSKVYSRLLNGQIEFTRSTQDIDEIALRAIEWKYNPIQMNLDSLELSNSVNVKFYEKYSAKEKIIEEIVSWLYLRKKISEITVTLGEYYNALPHSGGYLLQAHYLPIIRAYFSSPLRVGQIWNFLDQQKYARNQSAEWHLEHEQIKSWVVDQVQPYRERLMALKSLLNSAVQKNLTFKTAEASRSIINFIAEDQWWLTYNSISNKYKIFIMEASSKGIKIINQSVLRGLIVMSEMQRIFSGDIPESTSGQAYIKSKYLKILSDQISSEINNPISEVELYINNLDKGDVYEIK